MLLCGKSGVSLATNQTCRITVRFTPTDEGHFTDMFTIPSNDPDENPFVVTVDGRAGESRTVAPVISAPWAVGLALSLVVLGWILRRRVSVPGHRGGSGRC